MNFMLFVSMFIAFASVLSTLQTGASATLQKQINYPTLTAVLVSVVGLVSLLMLSGVYVLWTKHPMPTVEQWHSVPWWAWTGGVMVAVFAMAIVLTSEKAGAGRFIALNVTVSIITSLLMDHFALLGFKQHVAGRDA